MKLTEREIRLIAELLVEATRSPEEKIREYYEQNRTCEYTLRDDRNRKWGRQEGAVFVLEALGIKIEGVNA